MAQNGWKKWAKQAGGGRFIAYENRLVVIISGEKSPYVYLTPPIIEALNSPEYVEIYTRGSNIGLFAAESPQGAYKVCRNHRGMMPYIALAALLKAWHLAPGVYEAYIESDHVVFDSQQKPSKI